MGTPSPSTTPVPGVSTNDALDRPMLPSRSVSGAMPVDATTGASSGTATVLDGDDAGARVGVGAGRSISWRRASCGLPENAITSRGIGQFVTGDHHGAVANTASTSA